MKPHLTALTPAHLMKRVEAAGLTLTEFVQPPAHSIPRHAHAGATLLFVLDGLTADEFSGTTHECATASLLIRPAGETHTHHYGQQGMHGLAIEVSPLRLAALRESTAVLERVAHLRSAALSKLAWRLYGEFHQADNASALAIEGLFLEMLAQAMRADVPSGETRLPAWLLRARDFLHAHYAVPLTLTEIAAAAGVHPAHLAETFRKQYGCTVGEYLRELRLEQAAEAVRHTEQTLTEIAITAGFYDQSHFTRLFKQRYGLTPAQFRRLAHTPKAHTKSLRLSNSN